MLCKIESKNWKPLTLSGSVLPIVVDTITAEGTTIAPTTLGNDMNAHQRWVKRKMLDPDYRIAERIRINAWKDANRTKLRMQQRAAWDAYKVGVLTNYGEAACCLCGEDRIGALNLDHIAGGGSQHRKAINKKARDFYAWIIAQSYPTGYRVLCSNCNWCEYLKLNPPKSQTSSAINTRRHLRLLKKRFMERLGNQCVVCGFNNLDVLTVHHKAKDGANHRRQVSDGKSGYYFYRRMLVQDDLSMLECRCFSCNDAEPRY